ncbi:MAG: PKD domain-containing protein [Thermoplasmata archaeon]|nr:PKD domain-containing protein [Thermoplasmata archaeon]
MKLKIIVIALIICIAFPAFQAQGQIDSKPEILDTSQGIPSTGEDYTITSLISDPDDLDTVRFYVYFEVYGGITTPEYLQVSNMGSDIYQSSVNVPLNASVLCYVIYAYDVLDNANNTDVLKKDVEDTESPHANHISLLNVPLGTSYQFNGTNSTDNIGIANYSWSFTHDDAVINLFGAKPVFNFTNNGTYSVTMEVIDAEGNWDTTSISVLTNDVINPLADPGIDQFEYIGQLTELDGSGSTDNVGIEDYAWTFYHNDTLFTLKDQNSTFRFWEVGEYNVTLTVTDAAGNSDQSSFVIHVLYDDSVGSQELPWWVIGLTIMILLVIITTALILRSSKDD